MQGVFQKCYLKPTFCSFVGEVTKILGTIVFIPGSPLFRPKLGICQNGMRSFLCFARKLFCLELVIFPDLLNFHLLQTVFVTKKYGVLSPPCFLAKVGKKLKVHYAPSHPLF